MNEDLRERFPDLRPISSAPSLATINGIGTVLYGKRDHDAETGTWVATRYVALLFVPVLALDAYRVAKADQGWYFLGKQPLGPLAKSWNLLLAAGIALAIGVGWWESHISTPAYQAGVRLTSARADLAADRLGPAVGLFTEIARGGTVHAEAAVAGLSAALARLPHASAAAASQAAPGLLGAIPPLDAPTVVAALRALADAQATVDPAAALHLVDLLRARPDAAPDLDVRRLALLTRLAESQPAEPRWAVELAVLAEAAGDVARCESVLAPHRERLAAGEGARILGRILADRGEHDAAHALLYPYCAERLKRLQALEKACNDAWSAASDRAVEELRQNAAPSDWYQRYEAADKTAQQAMVDAWIQPRVAADTTLATRQAELRAAAAIVPVAIDLGIVTLRRSQDLADPVARKKELESAEAIFLAIRGIAGESDAYRLFYGQVCGWLGKHEESRQQFDDLLVAHKRAPAMLVEVAKTVRYLGDSARSRTLAEEAWNSAASDEDRWMAAGMRSRTSLDAADQVLWLGRCDPTNSDAKAALESALGDQANEAGDDQKAAVHLRRSLEAYATLPKTAASLNNCALVCGTLYAVTGEAALVERTVALLEESIALAPSDSIGLSNLSGWLMAQGAMAAIGDRLDLAALRSTGREFDFCYRDRSGRAALATAFANRPETRRALAMGERLQILRPQDATMYWLPLRVLRLTRNLPGLRALRDRIRGAALVIVPRRPRDAARESSEALALRVRSQAHLAHVPVGSTTWAVAAASAVHAELEVARTGGDADRDATVALAERVHSAQPTVGANDALVAALLSRAEARVMRLAGVFAQTRPDYPDLTSGQVLAIMAKRDPAIAVDPDVQRVAGLIQAQAETLPEEVSSWEWALLDGIGATGATTVGHHLADDSARALLAEIILQLDPQGATEVLNMHWWRRLTGDAEGARQVLGEARERKVELPDIE